MAQWEWWIKKSWLEGLSAQGKIFQQGRYNTPGARLGSHNTWSLCMNSWPRMGGIDWRVQADFCCFFPYIWCFGGYMSFLAWFNKGVQTGKLKKQKCVLRRLGVWSQGVDRAILSLKHVKENPSLPLIGSGACCQSLAFLVCRYIIPISASFVTWMHGCFLLFVHITLSSSSSFFFF